MKDNFKKLIRSTATDTYEIAPVKTYCTSAVWSRSVTENSIDQAFTHHNDMTGITSEHINSTEQLFIGLIIVLCCL